MPFGSAGLWRRASVRARCSVPASPIGVDASTVTASPMQSAARGASDRVRRRSACVATLSTGAASSAAVAAEQPDSVASASKGKVMAKATVDVLVDDLDGSEAVETVRIGWNGDWRELDLSKRNLASLSKALDRYWNVSRTFSPNRRSSRRRPNAASSSPAAKAERDPKLIRAWATANGISIPARGRIPGDVERRYDEANGRS
jgi:nucleoid-associated protein Lsr2